MKNPSISIAILSAALLLFSQAIFHPGYMDPDNIEQLRNIRLGLIPHDIHSPVYIWTWMQLDKIYPGPALLLLFYQLCFFIGASLFARSVSTHSIYAYLIILTLYLSPALLSWFGTITKDNAVICILMLSVGLICKFRACGNPSYGLAAILSIIYLLTLRHNVALLALPISIWLGTEIFRKSSFKMALLKSIIFSILIFAASICLNAVVKAAYSTQHAFTDQQIYTLDLAGLSLKKNEMLIPNPISSENKQISLEELRQIYDPFNVVSLYWSNDVGFKFYIGDQFEPQIRELRSQWLRSILDNPEGYLKQRLDMVKMLFGITSLCGIDGTHDWNNPWNYKVENGFLTVLLKKYIATTSIFFSGWIYVFICLAGILLGAHTIIKKKQNSPLFWISIGGFLYSAAYVIIAPVCFFRLIVPTVLCAQLCAYLVIKHALELLRLKQHSHGVSQLIN